MQLSDSLTNIVSGLGTDKDKLIHSRFLPTWLGKNELDAMYEGSWIAAKAVDAPCDDITRDWRTWDAKATKAAAITAEENRLNVRQRVNTAMKMARLYGGAAILIGDGSETPEKELDLDRIARGGIKYLHVLSRWELAVELLDRDPLSLYFGEPVSYRLASGTRNAEIHPSRLVRFLGPSRLELSRSIDGWGLSLLQRIYDAVRNVTAAANNTASLTHEAKVDVISVPDLNVNAVNPAYQMQLMARFGLANMAKSNQNMLLLDALEVWNQKQVSFAGLVDVINRFLEIAAGAADMPVTRFLGSAPKGLNASDQSGIRAYYDGLAGKRTNELEPTMHRLDEALIRSALGNRPANVKFSWAPLWQMDEAEQQSIALQAAQTSQIYAGLGVMPKEALQRAVQSLLVAAATYPGLQDILDETKGQPCEPLSNPAAAVLPESGKVQPQAAKPV